MLGQTQDSIKGCVFFHLEVSEGQAQDYIVFCVSQSFLVILCFAVMLAACMPQTRECFNEPKSIYKWLIRHTNSAGIPLEWDTIKCRSCSLKKCIRTIHFIVPNWRAIIKLRFWSRGSAQFIKGLFLKKWIIFQRVVQYRRFTNTTRSKDPAKEKSTAFFAHKFTS